MKAGSDFNLDDINVYDLLGIAKPKNQKMTDDIIPQANLRETKITMEGFDLDTFNFLAKKYSGQEVEVRIKVIPKSHICTLSE